MRIYFVNDRLSFGSAVSSEKDIRQLLRRGITHVINLRRTNVNLKDHFNCVWLPRRNDYRPRTTLFYRKALNAFRKISKQNGSKLFVMCHHGYHRSPSLVYFFLRASGVPSSEARHLISQARLAARVVTSYAESAERFLSSQSVVRRKD